jgi:hypothetical protein
VLVPARSAEEKLQFTDGAAAVERRIRAEEFGRNTQQCFLMGECPYVPLCYPSQKHRITSELTRQTVVDPAAIDALADA